MLFQASKRFSLIWLVLIISSVFVATIIVGSSNLSENLKRLQDRFTDSSFRLTETPVYNQNYRWIQSSNNVTTQQFIHELQYRLAQSLNETKYAKKNITSNKFYPLRAFAVSDYMEQYGYVHRDEPFNPICLSAGPGQLARTPNEHKDPVKPMCFSVLQNAYLGPCGVVIQPMTSTVFDIAGGCCVVDWKSYLQPKVSISREQIRSFEKFKGKIVLSLAHHHSTTYHHVIHEVLSRYLLVVPLLDAVPEIFVALDDGYIAPQLLQMLGLSKRRILRFTSTCNKAEWRFASVLLLPMASHAHEFMGYYKQPVTMGTTAILRALVDTEIEEEDDEAAIVKKKIVLIERARSRSDAGDCKEQRCVKNLGELEEKLKERFSNEFDVVVYKATYNVRVAIEMFARADVIVGVHGAGFQNMMFCRKGTTVVHIGWDQPMYKSLADEFDLVYHLVHVAGLEHRSYNFVIEDVKGLVQNVSRAMVEDGVIEQ